MLEGLRFVARAAAEPAEAKVAVGQERAHPQVMRDRRRVAIVGFRLTGLGRVAPRGGLTQRAEAPRL
jgi:hypothetical protein